MMEAQTQNYLRYYNIQSAGTLNLFEDARSGQYGSGLGNILHGIFRNVFPVAAHGASTFLKKKQRKEKLSIFGKTRQHMRLHLRRKGYFSLLKKLTKQRPKKKQQQQPIRYEDAFRVFRVLVVVELKENVIASENPIKGGTVDDDDRRRELNF